MNKNIPNHIGFIVDGNRRWAKTRGLTTLEGHSAGEKVLSKIIETTFDRGVKYISAYIFSTENWARDKEEVDYLMKLFVMFFDKEVKKLHKNNIRVTFLGNRDEKIIGKKIANLIKKSEKLTEKNTRGTLAICFNYGGQLEIAEAVKKIIAKKTPVENITPELISENLYHPEIPPLDLMVRTSGEQRISNFMLWRISYAELLFCKKNWPDMAPQDIDEILAEFSSRHRRFGAN